jgi:hypothetical protein
MSESVNEMLVTGKISGYLTDTWRDHHQGVEPKEIAKEVLRRGRLVRHVMLRFVPGCLTIAVLIDLATLWPGQLLRPFLSESQSLLYSLFGSMGMLMIPSAVMMYLLTFYKREEYELFPEAYGFENAYQQLLKWSRTKSDALPNDRFSLRVIANNIVYWSAIDVARTQAWIKALSPSLSDDDDLKLREAEVTFRRETKRRYAKLLEWDLVGASGLSSYYEAAEKHVARMPLFDCY